MQLSVWDIWVRLFHWSLAVAVFGLLYTGLSGEGFYEWHRQLGECVLLLILFRVCWGMVGSSNSRFSRLFRRPLEAVQHLRAFIHRDVPAEREHNAAGAWAVLAMLLSLGIQALTGMLIADEDEMVEGALYGSVSSDVSSWLYSVHMINAKIIQIIVAMHVLMIAAYFFYGRRNLLLPMFTGKLNWPDGIDPPPVYFQRWWVGLLCLIICAAGVGWLGNWY